MRVPSSRALRAAAAAKMAEVAGRPAAVATRRGCAPSAGPHSLIGSDFDRKSRALLSRNIAQKLLSVPRR
jgi:hypothetical protein